MCASFAFDNEQLDTRRFMFAGADLADICKVLQILHPFHTYSLSISATVDPTYCPTAEQQETLLEPLKLLWQSKRATSFATLEEATSDPGLKIELRHLNKMTWTAGPH